MSPVPYYKPDLAVAFQPGFSVPGGEESFGLQALEYFRCLLPISFHSLFYFSSCLLLLTDYEWTPSLRALWPFNVPLICTTSSLEEQARDLLYLQSQHAVKVLFDTQKVHLASPRPLQSGTMANDLYYKNSVVVAVRPPAPDTARPREGLALY